MRSTAAAGIKNRYQSLSSVTRQRVRCARVSLIAHMRMRMRMSVSMRMSMSISVSMNMSISMGASMNIDVPWWPERSVGHVGPAHVAGSLKPHLSICEVRLWSAVTAASHENVMRVSLNMSMSMSMSMGVSMNIDVPEQSAGHPEPAHVAENSMHYFRCS